MKNKSRKKSVRVRQQDLFVKIAKALPARQKLLAQGV